MRSIAADCVPLLIRLRRTEHVHNTEPRQIVIFDTTLRDGEQSPGCSMNLDEKLEVAQALVDLGVDVIEAGFPIASPGDFEAVREIASTVRGATICGLARCNDKDIDRAWEALQGRAGCRGFTSSWPPARSIASSSSRWTRRRSSPRAIAGVKRAKGYCDDIEFSPEDAARTEPDFLCQVVEAAIDAGATTVNIPDTVGYATPAHFANVIKNLVNRVPNIDKAVISVHCHNDLGLAVANSLAAVENGAGQIECTINGIGERAGNCSLEEVVMAMRTRQRLLQHDDADQHAAARAHQPAGLEHHRHAGAAQQGDRRPQRLRPRGRHPPGRHAQGADDLRNHAAGRRRLHADRPGAGQAQRPGRAGRSGQGARLSPHAASSCKTVFDEFKKLADKKKEIYDADIAALIEKRMTVAEDQWKLVAYEVHATGGGEPTVSVTLDRGGEASSARRSPAATARSTPCSARSRRSPARRSSSATSACTASRAARTPRANRRSKSSTTAASTAAAASRPTPSKRRRWRSSTRSTARRPAAASRRQGRGRIWCE